VDQKAASEERGLNIVSRQTSMFSIMQPRTLLEAAEIFAEAFHAERMTEKFPSNGTWEFFTVEGVEYKINIERVITDEERRQWIAELETNGSIEL